LSLGQAEPTLDVDADECAGTAIGEVVAGGQNSQSKGTAFEYEGKDGVSEDRRTAYYSSIPAA